MKKFLLAICLVIISGFGLIIYAPTMMIARSPITQLPSDFGLTYQDKVFRTNDGVDIAAWWVSVDQPNAAVIFVHGGQSNRSSPFAGHLALMKDLHNLGYATLAIDLRNHGESGTSPNGPMPKLGVEEWQDVSAAAAFLANQYPKIPIFAFGSSMGGATILHAAYNDGSIRAVATQDPVLDHRPAIRNFIHATTPGVPELVASAFLWSMETFHDVPLSAPLTFNIAAKAAERTPIFIIQNEADPIVDKASALKLANQAPSVELWLTPAPVEDHPVMRSSGPWGTHVRSYTLYREEFVSRLDAFFDKAISEFQKEIKDEQSR